LERAKDYTIMKNWKTREALFFWRRSAAKDAASA